MAYNSIIYLHNDETCQRSNFDMASRIIAKNDLCHLRGFLYLDHHASDAHVLVCVHSDLFGQYRSPADQHNMTKRSILLKQRYREQLK